MKTRTKLLSLGAVALAIGMGTYSFAALSDENHRGFSPPFARMMMQGGQGSHMMGGGYGNYDADTMPGAMHEGVDATAEEMREIHLLFTNHDEIDRSVTNLADGIRTVTESDDPQIAEVLQNHVAGMIQRVGEGRDPGLPIESEALRSIFANYDKIVTEIETTDNGIIVTQTSQDAQTVAFLQEHAGQVSEFAELGMTAVHRTMAQNGSMHDMMGGGRHGPARMHGGHGHGG